jgi:hypothetical protein
MPSALLLNCRWSRAAVDEINRYFDRSISALKHQFPALRFTFSFQEFGAGNLRKLDLSHFDLLEAHIWLSDDFWWSFVSGHYKAAFGHFFSDGVRQHALKADQIYPRYRERCRNFLLKRLQFWKTIADQYGIPLVTTEGWASTFYDDRLLPDGQDEWAWIKEFTEEAVNLAIENGWSGICTSNFCQPHFRRFWADREWHRKMTHLITAEKPR